MAERLPHIVVNGSFGDRLGVPRQSQDHPRKLLNH
jgi:hypothetical protein